MLNVVPIFRQTFNCFKFVVFWGMILLNLIDTALLEEPVAPLFILLMTEAACSSETLLPVYCWTAWCYIPEDHNLDNSAL